MSLVDKSFKKALAELEHAGLLLECDPMLPSVCQVVTGAPIKGSWWGHEFGKVIYAVCGALEDHPSVVKVKLLFGKGTYVHRSLWPALLGAVTTHAPCQHLGLTAKTEELLARVEHKGLFTTEGASKAAVQMLEKRMLVLSTSIHTTFGRHVKRLESWNHWQGRIRDSKPASIAREDAYLAIEAAAARQCGTQSSKALPW